MSSDDRAFLMQAALSMNTCATVPYIYPRLFPLVSDPQSYQFNSGSVLMQQSPIGIAAFRLYF